MPQAQSRAACSQVRSRLFDGFINIPVRAGQSGSQSEKKSCHDRSYTCREDDAAVNRYLLDSRYVRRYPSDHDIQPEGRHEQSGTGADESEDCAFDQGLPDQAPSARADCSRRRDSAKDSRRLAMLPHASNSRTPTAASNNSRAGRTLPVT